MPEQFFKVRRGVAFKNGKAYFFSPSEIVAIRTYANIRAWRKTPETGWRPWRVFLPRNFIRIMEPKYPPEPSETKARDYWEQRRILQQREFARVAWAFSKEIPLEVRRMVRTFGESQYELLQAFGTVTYARELAACNPALLYALVRNDRFAEPPVADRLGFARRWILKKQKELSGRLGFPESRGKSSVPALGKLPPGDIKIHRLWWLQAMLRDADLHKILHFAPIIDATAIGVLWDLRELVDPTWMTHLVMNYDGEKLKELRMLGRDVIRMWQLLGRPWPPPKKVCGRNAFEELHDECWRNLRRRVECEGMQVSLGEKPLPGTEDITLLNSTRAIIEEGEAMQHCCASYIPKMTTGKAATLLYTVTWPERATLRLDKAGQRWRIAELRGYRNRPVSDETWEYVGSWVRDAQEQAGAITGWPGEGEIDPEMCPF